ncbi:Hpt domain-containing protein [Roseibium aestuarii]|uniref:Hpt domain-containing protein n=1 Tax=Roseibium aestuarii TaxID=2600299 RepID=A0ABW4JY57_9HYPH|nr:Hpt domain-containing protein [Roseibium aestuarii]
MTSADKPSEDVEYITPPDEWRKKVRVMSKREAAKFDPVKAAEQAIARLAKNFPNWMETEARALVEQHDVIRRDGLNADTLDPLYQAAHNIKGQAQTLGYPLIGEVAGSLCTLIECVPSVDKIPPALLARHVESIRAMVLENARDENNQTGAELLATLRSVTADVIAPYAAAREDDEASSF